MNNEASDILWEWKAMPLSATQHQPVYGFHGNVHVCTMETGAQFYEKYF